MHRLINWLSKRTTTITGLGEEEGIQQGSGGVAELANTDNQASQSSTSANLLSTYNQGSYSAFSRGHFISPMQATLANEDIGITTDETEREYINLISSDEDDDDNDDYDSPTTTATSTTTEPHPMHNIIDLTLDDDDASPRYNLRNREVIQKRFKKIKLSKREKKLTKRQRREKNLVQRKQRRTIKAQWNAMIIAKAIEGRCSCCLYTFKGNGEDPPLSRSRYHGLCAGCFALHRLALLEGDKMEEVIHWLKTGELSVYTWENEVDNAKEEHLVKKRASEMKNRLNRKKSVAAKGKRQHAREMPTEEDLYDLYLDCECKCAITGWTCHFGKGSRQKYWAVTFDHIVPVSIAPEGMNPWTISNIQVMCHLLNQLKGNTPDEELRRWFHVWKGAQ